MKERTSAGATFRERYAVTRLTDGGVLVDLITGAYLRLNASAAEICLILADFEDVSAAKARVARRFNVDETDAGDMIQSVVEGLVQEERRREPVGAFRYRPEKDGGYILTSNSFPRISIEANGTSLRMAKPAEPMNAARIFEYLRAVAPKLLFLRSEIVIHGAASRIREGVRVISGESGAGKTTTARAFDKAGATIFSEDMLIVASLCPLRVYTDGERAINVWAAHSAECLARSPRDAIEISTLRVTDYGDSVDVAEIWFIDGARRGDFAESIVPRKLGQTEGTLATMTSLFLGSASGESWRAFLTLAGKVATTVPLFEALMPTGLERLQQAAKRYMENSAS